jgi:hypothetical protein
MRPADKLSNWAVQVSRRDVHYTEENERLDIMERSPTLETKEETAHARRARAKNVGALTTPGNLAALFTGR